MTTGRTGVFEVKRTQKIGFKVGRKIASKETSIVKLDGRIRQEISMNGSAFQ